CSLRRTPPPPFTWTSIKPGARNTSAGSWIAARAAGSPKVTLWIRPCEILTEPGPRMSLPSKMHCAAIVREAPSPISDHPAVPSRMAEVVVAIELICTGLPCTGPYVSLGPEDPEGSHRVNFRWEQKVPWISALTGAEPTAAP